MAAQKSLQKDSEYAHLDIDGDGIVTDEELEMDEKMLRLQDMKSDMENEDKKEMTHNVTWHGLLSLVCTAVSINLL